MVRLIIFLLVGVALIFAVLYFRSMRPKEYNQKIKIGNTVVHVAIADDLSEQINGLSGVGKLCSDCGMLFVFPKAKMQSFWMHGMNFPLDFIFIRDGKVTEVVENVPQAGPDGKPSQIFSRDPADMVLEVNAGFVKQHGITVDHPIEL